MKFKSLAVLGILLVSLSSSSGVAYASEGTGCVYETDSSYDVSNWIKPDGTVETNFTYEDAPWIADDGTVDNDLAHYFRLANAEAGGMEVNEFYNIARKDAQVYKDKDRNSEVIEEFDLNDLVYIHLVYEDGWAWSGEYQGYVPLCDLSEDSIGVNKVDAYYKVDGVAHPYKDVSSEAVNVSGTMLVKELHSDGWAYLGDMMGFVRQEDLSGKALKEKTFTKESSERELSGKTFTKESSEKQGAVTVITDDYEITISPKKN